MNHLATVYCLLAEIHVFTNLQEFNSIHKYCTKHCTIWFSKINEKQAVSPVHFFFPLCVSYTHSSLLPRLSMEKILTCPSHPSQVRIQLTVYQQHVVPYFHTVMNIHTVINIHSRISAIADSVYLAFYLCISVKTQISSVIIHCFVSAQKNLNSHLFKVY